LDVEDEILRTTIQRDQLTSEQQEAAAYVLGDTYYLVRDDEITEKLKNDQLDHLIPFFSSLNRTSNIDRKTGKKLLSRLKLALLITELEEKEDSYDLKKGFANILGWLNFGELLINDAIHGWRGKLVTHKTKISRIEVTKPKRRKWLF